MPRPVPVGGANGPHLVSPALSVPKGGRTRARDRARGAGSRHVPERVGHACPDLDAAPSPPLRRLDQAVVCRISMSILELGRVRDPTRRAHRDRLQLGASESRLAATGIAQHQEVALPHRPPRLIPSTTRYFLPPLLVPVLCSHVSSCSWMGRYLPATFTSMLSSRARTALRRSTRGSSPSRASSKS